MKEMIGITVCDCGKNWASYVSDDEKNYYCEICIKGVSGR